MAHRAIAPGYNRSRRPLATPTGIDVAAVPVPEGGLPIEFCGQAAI